MGVKFIIGAAAVFLVLACAAEARHVAYRTHHDNSEDYSDESPAAGRRPHPASLRGIGPSQSHKQARVFPGAVAIKKLVLLKFKKIIPISLIVLKSSNENEAELVPVYPTSEIPADVQFIPTPNGISGHKDVQAIAIPNELHQQLELNGLANVENIQALLNHAEEEQSDVAASAGQGNSIAVIEQANKDDEILDQKEDDEDQLLDGVAVEKPVSTAAVAASPLRRLAAEDTGRVGLRTSPQTAVEEIPLYLYSAKDAPQWVHRGRQTARRYHA